MVKIKVSFKEGYIGQPSEANSASNIRMTIDYVQNFSENGTQILPPEDRAYTIGDKVTFAGSDWYVIEDSPSNQDYVTVLKENVLTASEIWTDYNYKNSSGVAQSRMAYYWSSTCHATGTYGNDGPYSSQDTSGCRDHNIYEESKIKEYLEEVYLSLIDSDNTKLKEINNYKIRLITVNELDTLGCNSSDGTCVNSQYSSWLYSVSYWTMTPYSTTYAWNVFNNGTLTRRLICGTYVIGVRPVINLYKSAIVSE